MKSKSYVTILLTMCVAASLIGCGGGNQSGNATTPAKTDASGRCPHEIKQEKCPFCTPSLVESDGFCGEHGVAEALCYQCRPYLKAAFRAKGDWCAEHSAPESQCVLCHPELKEKMRPGEHGTPTSAESVPPTTPAALGNCEHGIAQAKCPFCTPSLIESDGFCKEHNVAEALCVQCRPYLETAFKAKGDWCGEHNTPESQCVICNPELKNQPGGSQG
jgi:membrane fusion protein, heavy metal efflux system